MDFSIIIPVYNVGPYLSKCLNSLSLQRNKNYELILVDDGSTDESSVICDEFASKRIDTIVIHKANEGLSSARNVGLNIAKGEYIVFIDSDDTVDPEMLAICADYLSNNPDVDILNFGFRRVDEKGNVLNVHSYDNAKISKREALIEVLKDVNINSFAWSNIYKRTLFNDIKYPIGVYYEDKYVTYKLYSKANKIGIIPAVLYNYLVRNGSISNPLDLNKSFKGIIDNITALLEQYKFVCQYNLIEIDYNIKTRITKNLISALRTFCRYKNEEGLLLLFKMISDRKYYYRPDSLEILLFMTHKKVYSLIMRIYYFFR